MPNQPAPRFDLLPYINGYRSLGANLELKPHAWYDQTAVVLTIRLWRWEVWFTAILPHLRAAVVVEGR